MRRLFDRLKDDSDKAVGAVLAFLLLVSFIVVAKEAMELRQTISSTEEPQTEASDRPCVVIDAGHGGMDPGKVGINGVLEKDINLAIALKLKNYLEENEVNAVLTRQDDNGLYSESDRNKKVTDMKKRLTIIEENKPFLAVSIHQNSYPDESVSGVQVFYYKDSINGQEAANIMQEQLIESLKPDKERQAKDNVSYYLLKKTSVPLIIIECGFLSNIKESGLLSQDEYQDKVARAIQEGILKYLNCK